MVSNYAVKESVFIHIAGYAESLIFAWAAHPKSRAGILYTFLNDLQI